MLYRIAADGLVLFHLLFILFVLFGGLLVLKWRPLAWWHLPAAVWGVSVEVFHLPCPLTQWENLMRDAAGQTGYVGGFIEHYVWPVIYPAGLTPAIQLGLGSVVLVINVLVYLRLIKRWKLRRAA
ncbi:MULTISPECIES: DUF2784 domain-containing protein [unclassified Pseudomonas]|uniref:DUF2784 domain-containing protein n=1 Tax=unclassified Pseudomonas TaxID=196821 RepID=UPI000C87DB70|nr:MULTISPECIES: DUF2784 domain-containing protein [unclassified Pseudomonas]PMU08722.1 DUF2784 domain-containing protein [Pseudomonas sp. FW305-20]PMU16485.1 DUF2784 domain-containing protein [Pseudomonas sp. FW305-122]PMU40752.1 DUF2784 domain-containing protein [Pseudomonas sp. FW305-47B]PMX58391.1 DUF2784 domain-containing protein [Pseudomonas sp. FW305-33]PMX66689.1 DUF2784 domain-containing protein [Pseudomonas sp. FW305-60]